MKTNSTSRFVALSLFVSLSASLSACSMFGGGTKSSGEQLSQSGPNVVDVRSDPSTIVLNNNWQPNQPPTITAEIKDFTSNVRDVKLRFVSVPLEIPMQNISGTTWTATLTQEQIRTLAVGGQTTTYEVNVIARNEDGQIAVSKKPFEVAIKGPDLSKNTG
jgi:hypothetical protein